MSAAQLYLQSYYFGRMKFESESAFEFPQGLPGFESERSFAPIEIPEQRPLLYLQSLTREDLCLITLPVRTIAHDYSLRLLPEYLDQLGISRDMIPRIGEDLLCLAIITVNEDRLLAANLLAPIVVNIRTRYAVQAIQTDSSYSCRHPITVNDGGPLC